MAEKFAPKEIAMCPTRPLPTAFAACATPSTTWSASAPSGRLAISPVPGMSTASTVAPVLCAAAMHIGWMSIFQVSTPPLAISTGRSAATPP